ncbi:MAG: PLP-dependent aminotransferase family protein [Erysipelotrichaceae bacterium]
MLTYNFPDKKEKPLYEYLYSFIKEDILSGNIKPDEKLPSKRNLARQLKISLITVETAYNQLIIEGYIRSVEKKGYFTENISNLSVYKKENNNTLCLIEEKQIKNTDFPYGIWNRLSRRIIGKDNICDVPFNGDSNLRIAIARHLKDFHNLSVNPDSIFIGSGSEYLYSVLINYFGRKSAFVIEDPGHLSMARIYELNDVKLNYIPLDKEGISIRELGKTEADVIHISPAHHFPTGITMPLKRRMELLSYARNNNSFIIEDDYDSEFRFNSKPIPPIYALDGSGHTIYMNTFTFTLGKNIRIAYMVLPDSILNDFINKMSFMHNTVSILEQKVLALFIYEGHFESHISKMRKKYRLIHDELLNKLKPIIKKYRLKIIEADSGLHFIIKHSFDIEDKELEIKIKSMNLKTHTLSHYYHNYIDTKQIIVSYLNIEDIDEYLNSLNELFNSLL